MNRELIRKLLIKRKGAPHKLRESPVLKLEPSPLITNFEKWSGKKKKLYFQDENMMCSEGVRNLHLNKNMFALLLASPMRYERISHLKAPKNLMLQLKLRKLDAPIDSNKYSAELIPQPEQKKLHKSSYISNSKALLEKNISSATKWIPIPALLSSMRHYSISDVRIDKGNFLIGYVNDLQKKIDTYLLGMQSPRNGFQHWDVLVTYEIDNSSTFEIARMGDNYLNIVKLNIAHIDDAAWAEQTVKNHKSNAPGILLRFPQDTEGIYAFFRLAAYYSN